MGGGSQWAKGLNLLHWLSFLAVQPETYAFSSDGQIAGLVFWKTELDALYFIKCKFQEKQDWGKWESED